MADAQPQPGTNWWDAFPKPRARCATMPATELLALLDAEQTITARDFLLVDVRRVDYEGGTVAGSVNLPAHTLYQTRAVVYDLCKRAGMKRVLFYCGSCSDGGRGWKCANWFQDYVDEKGDGELCAMMLEGGIKGWVKQFGGRHVDGYDEKFW